MSPRQDCPPDIFARLVALTGRGPSQPVRVTGPVDLKGVQIDVPITFHDVHFAGRVEADSAAFKGYVQFINCVFEAGADFEAATIDGNMVFHSCKFGAPQVSGSGCDLRLDYLTIKGRLVLNECTLTGAFSAKHILVHGELSLASSSIGVGRAVTTDPAIDLTGARINSDLLLNDRTTQSMADEFEKAPRPPTVIGGEIRAQQMTVLGKVVAETYQPEKPTLCTALRMTGSTIGELTLDGFNFAGPIDLAHVTCNGSVSIYRVQTASDLLLYGTKTINIGLSAVEIKGHLNAGLLQCVGIFRISGGCKIGTEDRRLMLQLSGARIDGQLDMEATTCGPIVINGSRFGSFLIGANDAVPTTCSAIYAVNSEFTSYVRIPRLVVKSDPAESGTLFTGVMFQGCTFAGNVELWNDSRLVSNFERGWVSLPIGFTDDCRGVKISDELRFVHCHIKGDLDLTRVTMTSGAEGKIALDQCTVDGALRFCSPESFANRRRVNRRSRANARAIAEAKAKGTANWTPATAASLRLAGSTMLSVDLTGLQLMEVPPEEAVAGGATVPPDVPLPLPTGSIDARQVTVRRRFSIYDRHEKEDWVSATDIPGALWLDEADIGELVIASPSFSKGGNADVRKDGIVLERAVIGHLKVPKLPCKAGETGFPIPMALGGAQIRSFSFRMDDSNGGQTTPDAQDYVALLESDRELRRELYRSVYRQFRDVGNTRAALQMVVAEGYRTFTQPRGKWTIGAALGPRWHSRLGLTWLINWIGEGFARLWHLIFSTLLRYGASPLPMAVLGITLFFTSLFFVSLDSRNFEVSSPVREVLGRNGVSVVALVGDGLEGREKVAERVVALDSIALGYDVCDDGVVLGPAPEQWGAWEALWITTRYHVPIIGMSAVSEFEPTNDRTLAFAGLGPKTTCRDGTPGFSLTAEDAPADGRWFTAETWFTLMSILSWIIWPLVLTFSIRRLVRD